jgi:hypothetical protein
LELEAALKQALAIINIQERELGRYRQAIELKPTTEEVVAAEFNHDTTGPFGILTPTLDASR